MSPPSVWKNIVKRSAEAIDWIATAEGTSVLDLWSIVMYGMIQCVLVQFYAAVNGGDPEPLRKCRSILQTWSHATDAQSHGFYETTEEQPKSSEPADPNALGKKSLTLRTKAYTVVAMLAGIAEHHISSRKEADLKIKSDASPKEKGLSAPLSQASSSRPIKADTPVSSPMSPYSFSAVLNPNGPIAPLPSHHGSISSHHNNVTHPVQHHYPAPNPNMAAPTFPANTHHLFSSNNLLNAHPHTATIQSSSMPPSFMGDIAEVDLLTLQDWAQEIMSLQAPNIDILSFAQQQQQQLANLEQQQQKQSHHPF